MDKKKKLTKQIESKPRVSGSGDGGVENYYDRKDFEFEISRSDLEEIDDYLNRKPDYEIYEELTDENDDSFELFEPLEFFHLLYEQIDFIEANKNKPLLVSKNLKKQSLTDEQSYFLCEKILNYFKDNKKKTEKSSEYDSLGRLKEYEKIDICCREISKLQENLDVYEDTETPMQKQQKRFQDLLKHLESLPDELTRIKHLKKTKIEYKAEKEQTFIQVEGMLEGSFYNKLEREINKRVSLLALEQSSQNPAITETKKKHIELTLDRAVLAMNYLLKFAKSNSHNTDKAKFISFLTGYSENTIVQKLSMLHKKEDENYVAYEKDMKIIRNYFEQLDLIEIVKMIDNDLET